jgi:hypothetical protein
LYLGAVPALLSPDTALRCNSRQATLFKPVMKICLVQKVLSEKEWLDKMQPEDFRGLTPLFYGHITPYGEFQLDMNKRLEI